MGNAEFYTAANAFAKGFLWDKSWDGTRQDTIFGHIRHYLDRYAKRPERALYWLGEEHKDHSEIPKYGVADITNLITRYEEWGVTPWHKRFATLLEAEIANINQQFVARGSDCSGGGKYDLSWEIWFADTVKTEADKQMGGEFPYLFMLRPESREVHVLRINYSAPENYYPIVEVTL